MVTVCVYKTCFMTKCKQAMWCNQNVHLNSFHNARYHQYYQNNYLLSLSHSLCSMSPCAQLSKIGSSRFLCLSIIWPRKDTNLANMTLPSPDEVEVALQDRWFSQGRIQSWISSQSFSFPIFDSTFRISMINK